MPRVAIGVYGGAVQWAVADCSVDVQVVDYDVEGETDFVLKRVTDLDGTDSAPANVYGESVEIAPAYFEMLDVAPTVNGEDEDPPALAPSWVIDHL